MLVLQAIIDGVLVGGFYALMAGGLTLVFGVMDIVNFAQGILVVLGAYLSYALYAHLNIDPFLGLLITIPVMFVVGIVVYWTMIKPIKRERVIMSLLTMFAVGTVVEGILDYIFTSNLVAIHTSYVNSSVKLGSLIFPSIYLYAFAMSVLLLGGVYYLLYRTRFGRSLRASMQNPTAARLVGINTDWVSAFTLGIGVGLAAAGGMVYGLTNSFDAASSYDLISRLLAIVIFGGFGSLSGALIASIIMLVTQDVVAVVWSPTWGQTTFYLILVLVLLLRPQGLLGRKAVRAQ
ncbi:MAG: branched-chain amino acid transport system permease protein [Trebonia sp.]|jgi:branched-chain amino acid transport system permease protein|nr:amino acid/amide transporter rane protein 1, family [Actinomycetes bacterium]MDX6416835.1 branched-chain amino acid transport system permease protein [Trebonia sp.]